MGRPPKPKAQKKSSTVRVRMSTEERKKLEGLAKADGLTISEFVRRKTKEWTK
jgi:hypothetical protein